MANEHLIRPIVYPTPGKHEGIGAEYRTSAEIAAMNDPRNPASCQPTEGQSNGRKAE